MADQDEGSAPPLPEFARHRIGSKLRAIFNDLEQEPLPDRITELLGRLESATGDAPAVDSSANGAVKLTLDVLADKRRAGRD